METGSSNHNQIGHQRYRHQTVQAYIETCTAVATGVIISLSPLAELANAFFFTTPVRMDAI